MRLRQAAGPSATGSDTHARGVAEPPEASVLRVLVACDDRTGAELGWATRFPAVPAGTTVTVTFTAVELLRDLPQLEDLGYVFAGVHSGTLLPPGVAAVDLLIPTDVVHEHPGWWEAIAAHADQAFPLVFGPVVKLFSELVRIHQAAPEHAS
ncbi:MAG: hypothetical protein KY437_03000 [Actinobacteria bacterium]|nr:hypothetical protein [Actinomycetota bacterium]